MNYLNFVENVVKFSYYRKILKPVWFRNVRECLLTLERSFHYFRGIYPFVCLSCIFQQLTIETLFSPPPEFCSLRTYERAFVRHVTINTFIELVLLFLCFLHQLFRHLNELNMWYKWHDVYKLHTMVFQFTFSF